MTARGGRPEIGTPINIRLGDDLLAAVDARAAAEGVSRAAMIRQLLTSALGQRRNPATMS